MKTLNLCEILKGHEGEPFYSSLFGVNVTLYGIQNNKISFYGGHTDLLDDGSYIKGGECMLFPSKDQRDWNKWAKEQKPKVPKTWSEIKEYNVEVHSAIQHLESNGPCELICKSALAFLKIHQLIKVGYGGNVNNEEWNIPYFKFAINIVNEEFKIIPVNNTNLSPYVVFHEIEQAEEFLKYPENVQLLKDYFMINE